MWFLAAAVLATASAAHAQTGYAGTYVASPAKFVAEVKAWGPDCGPQPKSETFPEQPKVEVRDQGAQLVLVFPDRTLRTNACWSPNPAVKVTSSTAADNGWRAECSTAKSDAKREVGRYTVTATSPFSLELTEESDYDWQLKSSHCVAKVRYTQRLERSQPGGAKPSAAAPAAPPSPAPAAAPEPPPCVPGTPVRIKLRPVEARIVPGQRLCFTVRGFDAAGCASEVDPDVLSWSLEKPAAARATLAGGCFRAAESTADAEGSFRVIAARAGTRAEASVLVAVPDLSDITARRSTSGPSELGSSGEATGTGLSGAGLKAVVESGGRGPWVWVGAGGLVAALGLLAWGLSSRRRSALASAPEAPSFVAPSPSPGPRSRESALAQQTVVDQPAGPVSVPSFPSSPPAGVPLICPTCRRGYTPGSAVCSTDGTALMPYADFVRQAKQAEAKLAACPACGQQLAPGAAFCGACGKRL